MKNHEAVLNVGISLQKCLYLQPAVYYVNAPSAELLYEHRQNFRHKQLKTFPVGQGDLAGGVLHLLAGYSCTTGITIKHINLTLLIRDWGR
jgi:hypothetical protein